MLLVTLIVTQREIFNMATWRPIKRFTCLIVSFVHSCIHRRFYFSLLFGPLVDAQEIFKTTVFRTLSETTGGTNIWFVVIVKIIYFTDPRILFVCLFGVQILRVWESRKFREPLEGTNCWRVYGCGSEGFLVTVLTSSNRKIKMAANSQETDFTHRFNYRFIVIKSFLTDTSLLRTVLMVVICHSFKYQLFKFFFKEFEY